MGLLKTLLCICKCTFLLVNDKVCKNYRKFGCWSIWEIFAKKSKSFLFLHLYFWCENTKTILPCSLGLFWELHLLLCYGTCLGERSINKQEAVREWLQRNRRPNYGFSSYQSEHRTCCVDTNSMSGHDDMLQSVFGCIWQFNTIKLRSWF